MKESLEFYYHYFTQQAYARMMSRMWYKFCNCRAVDRQKENCSWDTWKQRQEKLNVSK